MLHPRGSRLEWNLLDMGFHEDQEIQQWQANSIAIGMPKDDSPEARAANAGATRMTTAAKTLDAANSLRVTIAAGS